VLDELRGMFDEFTNERVERELAGLDEWVDAKRFTRKAEAGGRQARTQDPT
jgi:hypothetical protein